MNDARSVAVSLGMPYYVLNFTEEFNEKIIRKFIDSYERGETPNPCIDCNRYMALEYGANDFVKKPYQNETILLRVANQLKLNELTERNK